MSYKFVIPQSEKASGGGGRVMMLRCDKPCGNKTASGYCATTACINPQYSNIGTAQYGQGVQRRIITNADRIRSMTDEELAAFLLDVDVKANSYGYEAADGAPGEDPLPEDWLAWLREEAAQ